MSHDDFAFEPIPGVPQALPKGEIILWQGGPHWAALAWRSLFVRPVLAYFVLLMGWRTAEALSDGRSSGQAAAYAAELLPVLVGALGLLTLFAWIYARTTVYTLTSRRLIIRSGVALPITVNIPYTTIQSAGVARSKWLGGEIALKLVASHRVALLALWPHVRPWHFFPPEPVLLGLADPDRVADTLGRALVDSQTTSAPDRTATAATPTRVSVESSSAAHMGSAVSMGGAAS